MKKRKIILISSALVIALSSTVYFADTPAPGSDGDPVVTLSYLNDISSDLSSKISSISSAISGFASKSDVASVQNSVSSLNSNVSSLDATVKGLGNPAISFAEIVNGNAKLYATNSTSSSVLRTINVSAGVDVLESTYNWYKVKYYDSIGWIQSSNILTSQQKDINTLKSKVSTLENKQTVIGYGATVKSGVPLRSGPTTSYSLIASLNYYSGVEILEVSAGWYKVKVYDKIGWIQSTDIKILQ